MITHSLLVGILRSGSGGRGGTAWEESVNGRGECRRARGRAQIHEEAGDARIYGETDGKRGAVVVVEGKEREGSEWRYGRGGINIHKQRASFAAIAFASRAILPSPLYRPGPGPPPSS